MKGTEFCVGLGDVQEAQARLVGKVSRTPIRAPGNGGLLVKCENHQRTGSFKVRGALNKVLSLPDPLPTAGVVAASAGNHGLGVAYAARMRGLAATILVPRNAVQVKVDGIAALGAHVRKVAGSYELAEKEGQQVAQETGAVWISPYNDPHVIAGQGTIALEVLEQLPHGFVEEGCEVFVPVGGGGLISGLGIVLRALAPRVRLIGVQPEASPYMERHHHGIDLSHVVEKPTLADGLAGPPEPGSITFAIASSVVDEMRLVSESAIEQAIQWAFREAGEVIEPSVAVALAAGLQHRYCDRTLVVLTGGNIARELANRLIG